MIEINNHNGTWECWIGGRIYDWNDDLQILLKKLANKAEDIETEINDQVSWLSRVKMAFAGSNPASGAKK